MRSGEIRQIFLDFFKQRDHLILPSFSLVPRDDPSLLLIGAGMAPLKPYFSGEKEPPHPRVATCQKCVRTPDIEKVGRTSRHATFFEMLGNFSFGNYFKKEAITWAWELVTKGYRLPAERLWISVYESDDEAFDLWKDEVGVPPQRIVRLSKEDNFWEIGAGPCGPCSEIYYDLGEAFGCGREDCKAGCDCDRYLEIWNLVFTQFNRTESGDLIPLAQKNIDTGAGLERLAVVLQGVQSLYETDLVKPLLDYFAHISGYRYGSDPEKDVSLRIVAEHLRTVVFLVGDGVLPANEGRGYVLRRVLRRALRHGYLLGLTEPFLYKAVPEVVQLMGDVYPELKERLEYMEKVVNLEEVRFQETLGQGMELLEQHVRFLRAKEDRVFDGAEAFKLYDTYGFPPDLTREILAEHRVTMDEEGFNRALEQQRQRGRAARFNRNGGFKTVENQYLADIKDLNTTFTGYDTLQERSSVIALLTPQGKKESLGPGDEEALVVLAKTPFFAESGGQVGDTGVLKGKDFVFRVDDTQVAPAGQILHRGRVTQGAVRVGVPLQAQVEAGRRRDIARSHTATHLVHKALREILGEHVKQAGSLVSPNRLRFDYTHFTFLSKAEIAELERRVNRVVWSNLPVKTFYTDLEEAKAMGAAALFEEKYGEEVRVVVIGDYSVELCGGTHVFSTGEIGLVKVIGETGIGTGLRRLEMLTGEAAYEHLVADQETLKRLAGLLKTPVEQLVPRLEQYLSDLKGLQKELQVYRQQTASRQIGELLNRVRKSNEVPYLSAAVEADSLEQLRELADGLKAKLSTGVIVLGAAKNGKVFFVATVSRDLVARGFHAGKIVAAVARIAGGGGGGKPEMAQAGAKNPEALPRALAEVEKIVGRTG